MLRRFMDHLHARYDRIFSSILVAAEAAAGDSQPDWECSTGVAASRRERLPARIVAAASASEFAASAASVTQQNHE